MSAVNHRTASCDHTAHGAVCAGEAMFVARPGATAEDDGVLLSLVMGADGERGPGEDMWGRGAGEEPPVRAGCR